MFELARRSARCVGGASRTGSRSVCMAAGNGGRTAHTFDSLAMKPKRIENAVALSAVYPRTEKLRGETDPEWLVADESYDGTAAGLKGAVERLEVHAELVALGILPDVKQVLATLASADTRFLVDSIDCIVIQKLGKHVARVTNTRCVMSEGRSLVVALTDFRNFAAIDETLHSIAGAASQRRGVHWAVVGAAGLLLAIYNLPDALDGVAYIIENCNRAPGSPTESLR